MESMEQLERRQHRIRDGRRAVGSMVCIAAGTTLVILSGDHMDTLVKGVEVVLAVGAAQALAPLERMVKQEYPWGPEQSVGE